jgi:hypothetical protein
VSAAHVIREVWRGERGILYRCRLECTCAWTSDWAGDPAALRALRAVHLDGPWAEVGAWPAEPDTAPAGAPLGDPATLPRPRAVRR